MIIINTCMHYASSTSMHHDHSTCSFCDHSIRMYYVRYFSLWYTFYEHRTYLHYDHSTCMIRGSPKPHRVTERTLCATDTFDGILAPPKMLLGAIHCNHQRGADGRSNHLAFPTTHHERSHIARRHIVLEPGWEPGGSAAVAPPPSPDPGSEPADKASSSSCGAVGSTESPPTKFNPELKIRELSSSPKLL